MTDQDFAEAFEACRRPNELFHHRDHLRLAWIHLQRYGARDAPARTGESIRRYAAHHGKAEKYHETVTIAWLWLLAQASECSGAASFAELLAACPELLDKNTLHRYYSPELLASETARTQFVPPDRRTLPSIARSAG